VLGHRHTPHCQWAGKSPTEDLGKDVGAAKSLFSEDAVLASMVAGDLLELEQLEEAAALAAAAGAVEEEDPVALGEESFLGLDSP
jgi:hypothetical protein